MAKLRVLPESEVIAGLAGVIDFYEWNGIPCARSWPRSPPKPRSPGVRAGNFLFEYINEQAMDIAPEVIETMKRITSGYALTWKDFAVRCYLQRRFAICDWHWYPKVIEWDTSEMPHKLIVTTDIPCWLGFSWNYVPYIIKDLPMKKRGVWIMGDFSVEVYLPIGSNQEEEEDVYVHTILSGIYSFEPPLAGIFFGRKNTTTMVSAWYLDRV